MSWVEAQAVLDADYPDGGRYYWKSANLRTLSSAAIDTMVEHAGRAPSDHSTIDVWFNGGAMARVPEEATPFGNREAPYLIGVEANWEDAAEDEANVAWVRELLADLEQHGSSGIYLNFAGTREEAASSVRAGHGANYERLASLKARYDPRQPLPPQPERAAGRVAAAKQPRRPVREADSGGGLGVPRRLRRSRSAERTPCGADARRAPRYAPGRMTPAAHVGLAVAERGGSVR